MTQPETGSVRWMKEQVEGLVESPFQRKEIREAVRLLADRTNLLEILNSDDPWRGVYLQDAVHDLPTSWQNSDDEMRWAFRTDEERDAVRALDRAIDAALAATGADLVTGIELIESDEWAAVELAARDLLALMNVDEEPPPLPRVEVIESVLQAMAYGELAGDICHAWAGQWTCREPFDLGNPVWHALDRICYWWGEDPEAPAQWMADLRAQKLDLARIVALGIDRRFVLKELGAYSVDSSPKATTEPSALTVKIVYWEKEGLPVPSGDKRTEVSEGLWGKLAACGIPDDALREISLEVTDYGRGLSEYWPGFKGWGRPDDG